MNLAVTGSTPVPKAVKPAPTRKRHQPPAGAGKRRSAAGVVPARRESVATCHVSAATQDGAMLCADIACASPWQRQTDADGNARAWLAQRTRSSQINALDNTGSSALRVRMWDRRFASPPTAFCHVTLAAKEFLAKPSQLLDKTHRISMCRTCLQNTLDAWPEAQDGFICLDRLTTDHEVTGDKQTEQPP